MDGRPGRLGENIVVLDICSSKVVECTYRLAGLPHAHWQRLLIIIPAGTCLLPADSPFHGHLKLSISRSYLDLHVSKWFMLGLALLSACVISSAAPNGRLCQIVHGGTKQIMALWSARVLQLTLLDRKRLKYHCTFLRIHHGAGFELRRYNEPCCCTILLIFRTFLRVDLLLIYALLSEYLFFHLS